MHLPTLPEKHLFTAQRLSTSRCAQNKKWDIVPQPLFQGLGVFLEEVKDRLQSQKNGCLQQNSICWTRQCCVQKLIAPDKTWTKPVKIPSTDQGGANGVPPLAEEVLGTDGCWERESPFSSGMQPPSGCPCSSGWSHTHTHTVALNRYNGREKRGWGGIGCKGWGDELDQNTYCMYKILQ